MSANKIQIKIPQFEDAEGDALMPPSIDFTSPIESPIITAKSSVFGSPDFPAGTTFDKSPETYDDHIAIAKSMVAQAVEIEEVYGVEAAADKYMEAKNHFLGAIGVQPIETDWDEELTDPTVLLQLGTCFSKLVQTSYAKDSYKRQLSRGLNKGDNWKKIAERSLKAATEIVMGEDISDEIVALSALVAAQGLDSVDAPGAAKRILANAAEKIKADGDEANLAELVDKQVTPSNQLDSEELHEVGNVALLDFATDSHEILALAA